MSVGRRNGAILLGARGLFAALAVGSSACERANDLPITELVARAVEYAPPTDADAECVELQAPMSDGLEPPPTSAFLGLVWTDTSIVVEDFPGTTSACVLSRGQVEVDTEKALQSLLDVGCALAPGGLDIEMIASDEVVYDRVLAGARTLLRDPPCRVELSINGPRGAPEELPACELQPSRFDPA